MPLILEGILQDGYRNAINIGGNITFPKLPKILLGSFGAQQGRGNTRQYNIPSYHSCMSSPLSPDPVRVQSCVYSEPIEIVWR